VSKVIVGAEGTPVVLEFGRAREGAAKMAKFKLTLFRGRVSSVSSSSLYSSSEIMQGIF
jgi:hypothetical protein